MKWYWYVLIGVAVLGIGYFSWKMLKKENNNDVADNSAAGAGASAGAGTGSGTGDSTEPVGESTPIKAVV